MQPTLIVNPLAAVEVLDESDDLICGGPVPGRGMRFLKISTADQPRLHSLFQELSRFGLSNLDVESDLEADDIEILEKYGVLITPNNIPERPLFECLLCDVEPSDDITGSLRVNPMFEFEPFDLRKFRSWMQEKHLSPHRATAWITEPETEIRWGYWLTQAEAEVVSRLEPGMPIDLSADPMLAAKLRTARILIDEERDRVRSDIDDATGAFAADRYAVIGNVIPAAQLRAIQTYFRKYVEQGFMKFGDSQVPGRFAEHGEPVAEMVHRAFTPFMSRIVGSPVRSTYAYSAVYTEGADLKPHVDHGDCEFSFSIQIDYQPEIHKGVSPWALYVARDASGEMQTDPANDKAIHLANGSCLAYKGMELVHYRMPLPAGHRSTSLFFHYIPA